MRVTWSRDAGLVAMEHVTHVCTMNGPATTDQVSMYGIKSILVTTG